MSVIVAVKDNDRFILGSDMQITCGDSKTHDAIKIWNVPGLDGAIMGGVGLNRASQILQYKQFLDRNDFQDEEDINTAFIVNSVTPCIVQALTDGGVSTAVSPSDATAQVMLPNSFIFAYKDKAWLIYNDLSVSEITDTYTIGSGSEIAKGVLFAATEYGEKNPFKKISMSIDAAATNTTGVDNNIDFLTTDDRDEDIKLEADALGMSVEEFLSELFAGSGIEVPKELIEKFTKKKVADKKKRAKKAAEEAVEEKPKKKPADTKLKK